ncbi:MAG: AAA family ATPase [Rickettsiaceae bacterium]|nr:AAA family ATPase [Rickettsiaceae bacterium]
MIIVGGANGAGKTTFVRKYLEENAGIIYLSADAIAEEIAPHDLMSAKIEAGRVFLERINVLINKKQIFLVESTFAGKGLFRYISKAIALEMPTSLIYVFNDSVEVSINRVRERVMAGGHDVPEEDIVRRYYRSLHNFWSIYRPVVDDWCLMYNSNIDFALTCIGNKNQQVSVIDQRLFKIFEEILNERQ